MPAVRALPRPASPQHRPPLHQPLPQRVPHLRPVSGARTKLRLSVAISAEVARDGTRGEFRVARARTLQWVRSRFGPLPEGFAAHASGSAPDGGCLVERHARGGTAVRVMDQESDSGRYFGLSVGVGGIPGLPAFRARVVLARSEAGCRLRATLRSPRQRPRSNDRHVWVPGIIHGLARSPGLVDYGWRIHPAPWIVHDEEGVRGFIELISEPARTRPVFAIGLGPGRLNPESASLNPFDLAHRTAGLAHVVVLTGPMTYVLTDRVGRRFSVFGNAVRTYRPGCVIGNEEREHPMALSDTVRHWKPGGPAEFAAFLTREAARTSVSIQGRRPKGVPGFSRRPEGKVETGNGAPASPAA